MIPGRTLLLPLIALALGARSAEIGSERWCNELKEKPKGEWTGNQLTDYTGYCLFN